MVDAELEVQNVGVDPRNRGFERPIAGARCIIANKTPETRRPKCATECAVYGAACSACIVENCADLVNACQALSCND